MLSPINTRAKMPATLAGLSRDFRLSYRDLLSTNPKTEKSKIQTYILHLAPAKTSGINVCPGAGNCEKICLHFAGNPVYMASKQAARIRRTLAYSVDRENFMLTLVCSILDKVNKNPGEPIAIRLNGTSDVAWENVDFTLSPDFVEFARVKFGASLPVGKRNIFEIFDYVSANGEALVIFYDYTKIRRNWAECKRLGYHLTFSFDGWENSANLAIARDALRAGVNVAAAFNLKKGQDLPQYVDATRFEFLPGDKTTGRVLAVLDGDLSDYRPGDVSGGHIVGLRFKLPHGIKYTDAEKMAFCIA